MHKHTEYSALIVDDDLESLDSMAEYLSIIFKTVHKAQNANVALEIFKSSHLDIIFTDLLMPDIDGFCLIENIRKYNLTIPIVIISAHDDKKKLLKAIKLDIIDFITKPLTSAKLKDTMDLAIKKLKSLDTKITLANNLVLNKVRFNLYRDGDRIHLTRNEAKLLSVFSNNINQPLDSQFLFDFLWSDLENKEYSSKSIRVLISKLRKKLLPHDLIQNTYGGKYTMVIDENS